MKIGILGGGAWGTALATILAKKNPLFIVRNKKTANEINKYHTNKKRCGGTRLPKSLRASDDIKKLNSCDVVLVVVPAQSFKNVCGELASAMQKKAKLVVCAKGIDRTSQMFLSEVAQKHFQKSRVAILSGPSFASDAMKNKPCAVSLAASSLSGAKKLAGKLSTKHFRIYASSDIRGVEAGGALKNVYALAVGMARGLGVGESAEAALLARSFIEMQNLVKAWGGKRETAKGLSGLGDLILTASSKQSRNFSYGIALGEGKKKGNKLAEGVATAKAAQKKARQKKVKAPILDAIVRVLEGKAGPKQASKELLARRLRVE